MALAEDVLAQTATCEPWVCPGTYVSKDVTSEALLKLLHDTGLLVPVADQRTLVEKGYNGTNPVDPPTDWDVYRKGAAVEWMRLYSEVQARQNVVLYHPWTSDVICAECPGWIRPGSVKIGKRVVQSWPEMQGKASPFAWMGVEAIQAKQPPLTDSWIVTCGMLRDAGKIKTREDCEREKAAAKNAYDALVKGMTKHSLRIAKTWAMTAEIMGVVYDIVYAVVVIVAPIAAVFAPLHTLVRKMQTQLGYELAESESGLNLNHKFTYTLEEMMADFNTVASGPLGSLGAVGKAVQASAQVTIAAIQLVRQLEKMEEERKEAREEFRVRRQRLTELNQQLAKLVADRAAIEDLYAAIDRLKAEVAENEAFLKQKQGSMAILIGIAALALLFMGRS